MSDVLRATIEESIATKQRLLARCLPDIEALCDLAVRCLRAFTRPAQPLPLCWRSQAACRRPGVRTGSP